MTKAFTLIEMMVVMAVMMVLTGIGAVSLNKFNSNQELDSQKEELMVDLKLAKNMAKTNQLPSGTIGSLQYVEVKILGQNVTVNGVSIDEAGNINVDPYLNPSKINKLTNNIDSTFGFSVENGRLTDDKGKLTNTPVCLTLYLETDNDDKKYVYIDTSGLIYEKNSCP